MTTVSCRLYEIKITDVQKAADSSTVYYFYPVNANAIELLCADTISHKVSYSFQSYDRVFNKGDKLSFNGKRGMYKMTLEYYFRK